MRKRPRHEAWLALAAFLTGCATVLPPAAKVDVLSPETSQMRSVAVLSDVHMQDFELADRLRTTLREECARHGYQVKETENEAELILVPTLGASSDSAPLSTVAPRPMLRKSRLFDTTRAPLPGSGLLQMSAAAPDNSERLALVVSAYRREDWLDPQFIDAPIPKAWRIVAIEPRREGQESEQVATLMAACGKSLDQLAENH